MPGHDVIVVGASAGGVEALMELVRGLPAGLPAAVLVVLHTSPAHTSRLPEILSRSGHLPATTARHGVPIERGHIYIAPPDHHLLVRNGHLELSRGPRENRTRPAVDPLFRSAARAFGPRVVGVILSGTLGDGSMGLVIVKAHGGIAIVQDPDEAVFGSMPNAAIQYAEVDHILPVRQIPPLLTRLAGERPLGKGSSTMQPDEDAVPIPIRRDLTAQENDERANETSVYSCPECGGVLWQIEAEEVVQFHCHVGHTYSPEGLIVQKSEALEAALWACVRMLREKAILTRQMAQRMREAGRGHTAAQIEEQAELDEQHIQVIREQLLEAMPNPIAQALEIDEAVNETG